MSKGTKTTNYITETNSSFFRSIEKEASALGEPPTEESMYVFWKEIWGEGTIHDIKAHWIEEAEQKSSKYIMM